MDVEGIERLIKTRSIMRQNCVPLSPGRHIPDIPRILSSLQASFVDQRSDLLKSLAERMTKLDEWMPRSSDEVQTAIRALFDQIGAFAVALQSSVDRGAIKYVTDISAELENVNSKIETVINTDPDDTSAILEALQRAYDSARNMFFRLMVGIQTARREYGWFVWFHIFFTCAFGIAAAVYGVAHVCIPICIIGGAVIGFSICGILYVREKRNENELVRGEKLKAIDMRDKVSKARRHAHELLLQMDDERHFADLIAMGKGLIAECERMEIELMNGIWDW